MNAPVEKMPAEQEFAGPEFSLHDIIDTLLQYAWLVGLVFAATLIVGVAYALIGTPIYKADVLVQVEEKKGSALGGLKDIAAALEMGQSPVQGEIEIVRSREVVGKAIAATSADTHIQVVNRFPLLGDYFAASHERRGLKELAEPRFGFDGYAWGGEQLEIRRFEVAPVLFGRTFSLRVGPQETFTLFGPGGEQLAQGQAGEPLAFKFGGRDGELQIGRLLARPGVEFKLTKLSPVRAYQDVNADLKVAETARQSGVMRLSFEDSNPQRAVAVVNEVARAYLAQNIGRRSAEAEQSLNFLQQQLPAIKAKLEESEQQLNAFRTRTGTVNVEKQTESLLTRAVALEKDRVELELKREQLSQRYRADYPELKAISESLAANRRDQGRLTDEVGRLPEQQKDLLRLARDVQVNTQLYTALLDNAQQLAVAKAGTIGNVRVIDYAVDGTDPVRPQRGRIVGVAAMLGLMLGVVAAVLARALRPSVRTSEELERKTGLVTYATIPESEAQERLLPAEARRGPREATPRARLLASIQPEDPAVEALRSLRTGLAFALLGAPSKTLLVTGPTQGLGKSFIAANLAYLLAQGGKRVLLVETDLRRPRLATYFGFAVDSGLTGVLAGTHALTQVLRKEVAPKLDVLAAGAVPPNPAELLLAPLMADLLRQWQGEYDHVILDSAPVLPVGDTLALAPLSGATFLVVRAEQSTSSEVIEAARRLGQAGAPVKGVILNGIKKSRVSYGSYYRYAYTNA